MRAEWSARHGLAKVAAHAEKLGRGWSGTTRAFALFCLLVYYVLQLAIFYNRSLQSFAVGNSPFENSLNRFFAVTYSFAIAVVVGFFANVCVNGSINDYSLLSIDAILVGLHIGWISCSLRFNFYNEFLLFMDVMIAIFLFVADLCAQRAKTPLNTSLRSMSFVRLSKDSPTSKFGSMKYDCLQEKSFEQITPTVSDADLPALALDMGNSSHHSWDSPDSSPTNVSLIDEKPSYFHCTKENEGELVNHNEDNMQFEGYRLKLDSLPKNRMIPSNVSWDELSDVVHRLESTSCNIYTAIWKGTPVVVKLIKTDKVHSSICLAEFETEASILSSVQHPNIIRLLGIGGTPQPFLILELLDGGSLSHSLGLRPDSHQRTEKRIFTMLEALYMARAIASAMEYLHGKWNPKVNILHRDLKPDNIGWSSDGTLKIFDFGLCACVRAQYDQREQYRLSGNTGTLRYMAPEVALGKAYDKSVDVYSFGMILWQVLRGTPPFREFSKKVYMEKVVLGGMRPSLAKHWPEQLKSLICRCWHDDKRKRPNFSEILVDLDLLIRDYQDAETSGWNYWKNVFVNQGKYVLSVFYSMRLFCLTVAIKFIIVGSVLLNYSKFITDVEPTEELQLVGASLLIISTSCIYLIIMSYCHGLGKQIVSSRDFVIGLEMGKSTRALTGTSSLNSTENRSPIHSIEDIL